MSQTRNRFLERKAQIRGRRKTLKGQMVCRGKIERRGKKVPCEYALYPRNGEIDSLKTCHRCHTIHVKTGKGWRTLQEAQKELR